MINTWKLFDRMKLGTERILRELGHSEDEIAYILSHCSSTIHRLREPYKTDILEFVSSLYFDISKSKTNSN
jgi:hypothetical protein